MIKPGKVQLSLGKGSKLEGWRSPLHAGKRLWFSSRSGFDAKASKRLRELEILHSDLTEFNALCRAVGIGEVPVN